MFLCKLIGNRVASWLFSELLQKVAVTIVFIITDLSVANNLL